MCIVYSVSGNGMVIKTIFLPKTISSICIIVREAAQVVKNHFYVNISRVMGSASPPQTPLTNYQFLILINFDKNENLYSATITITIRMWLTNRY